MSMLGRSVARVRSLLLNQCIHTHTHWYVNFFPRVWILQIIWKHIFVDFHPAKRARALSYAHLCMLRISILILHQTTGVFLVAILLFRLILFFLSLSVCLSWTHCVSAFQTISLWNRLYMMSSVACVYAMSEYVCEFLHLLILYMM